jgi:hypothetical protein
MVALARLSLVTILLALAALAAGCQRTLQGAPCPCLDDAAWTCCEATHSCVPRSQAAALCAELPVVDAAGDAAIMSHADAAGGATGQADAHADAHADAAVDRATDAPVDSGAPDSSVVADPPIPAGTPQVCTSVGWCWTHPLPAGDRFVQAFGVDEHETWVIGAAGTVLRSIDGVWSVLPSPAPALAAIWGTASNDVWVGGDEGPYHWDGNSWTFRPTGASPTSRAVKAIWGCQPNDVWQVGSSAAYHWDGAQWHYTDLPGLGLGLTTIWGAVCDDVWAGVQGPLDASGKILHWDGSAWSIAKQLPAERIVGTCADDIWSLTQSRLFHWGGAGPDLLVDGASVALFPVGGAAIGTMSGDHLVSVVSGGASTVLPAPAPPAITSLWGRSASDIWGVGVSGAAARWDGADWAPELPGWTLTGEDAVKVTGSGPSDVWVAAGGALLHNDGSIWRTALTPAQVGGRIWDIWAPSPDDVWVLGGDALIHRWNGAGWHTENPPLRGATTPEMRAISGTGPHDVWIVRGTNTVLHLDENGWTSLQPGVENLVDIWANAPDDVWVAGDQAAHWQGSGWFRAEVPGIVGTAPFLAVSGSGAADVWALAGGSLLHATSDVAFTSVIDTSSRLVSLSVTGPGTLWVLEQDGTTTSRLFHFSGGANDPSMPATLAPAGLNDIWAAPDGTLWAVGAGGAILQKRP